MKYFVVALALVAAFACIAESKPAESEHELAEVEEENELADLEDAVWLEHLADLSDLEEARGFFGNTWKKIKGKADKIMLKKAVKLMVKKEGISKEEAQAKVDAMSKKQIRLYLLKYYGKKALQKASEKL
uniref:M-zodatoxin-Lt8b n=1 Tax=Lachesana tarabaevi TaxID=379576 RepID=CTX12_LACTA|nr:RecName: Full=M-zodatoxin-Lt8b; Short=M-ZDTX-Lt8b; AltName: Full=Cytoinsectotoxin-1b; Short=CIT-1b; Flags: Precursor [Lachesana tarabaevi]CAQ63551.1 cyto-insectotoxin 1b precursor [Lachesana tarabaevi]